MEAVSRRDGPVFVSRRRRPHRSRQPTADVKDNVAEITLDGTLGGAIDGVATDIEVKAKLLFDIELKLPKTLLLAIKELRGIGHVSPGLDVVAKLRVSIAPLTEFEAAHRRNR